MRQLRMGLGWVFLIRGEAGSYCIVSSARSYRIVGWIVSYRLDLSISYRLDCIRKHWLLFAGWLLSGWDRWTGWEVSGMGVVWTNVSRRRVRSAAIGARMGAPPLDRECRQAVGSGDWHQLRQCCKGEDYLCRRSKITQIEYT